VRGIDFIGAATYLWPAGGSLLSFGSGGGIAGLSNVPAVCDGVQGALRGNLT